ncbi:hypothetical protein F5H01DRAFT_372061 [Linnemannia elongata]|nr:hypothetical protein F5H01DRAFT_372061 [Linnemannia elongata]
MLDEFSVDKNGGFPDQPPPQLRNCGLHVRGLNAAQGFLQGILPVLDGTTYIAELDHETEVNAHLNLLLSEDGISTVRIQTKDEEANSVMIRECRWRSPWSRLTRL